MFVKGQSGNPSGRPTIPPELKKQLKDACADCVAFWIDTLRDTEAKWEHREKASLNIYNYAYGKPKEIVDLDVNGRLEGFTIEIVDRVSDGAV